LIGGREVYDHSSREKLGIENIHIVNEEIDYAARNAVTAEGRQIDRDSIAGDSHVAGVGFAAVRAVGIFQAKAEACAVKVLSLGCI
jgi:hypothetical protein